MSKIRTRVMSFALAGIAAGMLLAPAASPAAAPRGCVPAGGTLLRTTDGVREYTFPQPGPPSGGSPGTDTFVCSDRSGRRVRVGRSFNGPRGPYGDKIEVIRFAGSYVALGTSRQGSYGVYYDDYIRRVNVTDGTQEITDVCTDCGAGSGMPDFRPGRPIINEHVTDLVVTRRGWIAWIADDQRHANRYSVGRRDSRGIKILDSSADMEPRSLAWTGTTIYWIAHGEPQDQDLY